MSFDHLVDAAKSRTTGQLDTFTSAYITDGGTYVVASTTMINDDDRPHDLVAVLPLALEGSHVVVLRPTVNPQLVQALRTELDADIAPHRLVLHFDDAESLHQALDLIGDTDAPVFLGQGPSRAESAGESFALWRDFDAAFAATDQE